MQCLEKGPRIISSPLDFESKTTNAPVVRTTEPPIARALTGIYSYINLNFGEFYYIHGNKYNVFFCKLLTKCLDSCELEDTDLSDPTPISLSFSTSATAYAKCEQGIYLHHFKSHLHISYADEMH